jgi:hypothetical protein
MQLELLFLGKVESPKFLLGFDDNSLQITEEKEVLPEDASQQYILCVVHQCKINKV